MVEKKESRTKKFARLVTEGPEDYRKKYAGKTDEQIREKMEDEMNEKMHRADARREQHWRDRDARRQAKLDAKMEKWNREDWGKPIFLRRLAGRRHTFWRVFWGVFFLVAAGAILGQIFGLLVFTFNIWWMILAIFLVAIIVAAVINLNWFMVFVPAACLVAIANYQTEWLPRVLTGQEIGGIFAVAVLLAIAFSILFHRSSYRKLHRWIDYKKSVDDYQQETDSDDGREVVIAARLGEAVRYIESKNLEKVFIDCVMGAVKVYFNNAEIDQELTINIRGTMGGVQIYLPRNWRVVNGLNATAGGVEEKGRTELTPDSPTVKLTGSVQLGGVEIVYI